MDQYTNKPSFEDIKKTVESSHLNFLIGSGASWPYFETLGEVENLLSALSKDSDLPEDEIDHTTSCDEYDDLPF